MYGRRRVGKTTILQEFAEHSNSIFFPAREKNDALNLDDFSKVVQYHFDHNFIASFSSWEDAFNYISSKVEQRTTIIIDEFTYIIKENPSIKSILQHVIDLSWKNKNIFLILCGSSVSIMENDVMGRKSPLHDRQTSSLEIKPFDYLESSAFFKSYTNEEKLLTYGILGGIPRYLEAFDSNISIQKNIEIKSIYVIKDNFFKFWFRYEFTNNSFYTMLGAKNVSKEIMDDISKSGYAKSVIEEAKKDHATLLTIGGNLKSYSYFPYNFIIAIVSLYSR